MSRHVLLIAASFHPLNVSGAHRPTKMAKYLPEFGWTPTVLTALWTPETGGEVYDPVLAKEPDVCRVVRVPYPPYPATKAGRGLRWGLHILFPYRAPLGFTRRMLAAGRRLMDEQPFDAIWATYNPGLDLTVGNRLSARYGVPWVADFRDVPDQDFPPWQLKYTLPREVRTTRTAAVLTAATQPQADTLATRYSAPVHAIMNGFDPDDYPQVEPGRLEHFTIRYGGILAANQDPRPLFEAVDRLEAEGAIDAADVRIEFYGTHRPAIEALAAPFRCRRLITVLPRVPHADLVRLEQRTAVLLLLSNPLVAGVMPAKAFEYLASKRPILDVPGGDVTRRLLEETQAGVSVATADEVARVLGRWYREWKATGTVAYRGLPEKISQYSRRGQAGQLAGVLDAVCGGQAVGGPVP